MPRRARLAFPNIPLHIIQATIATGEYSDAYVGAICFFCSITQSPAEALLASTFSR